MLAGLDPAIEWTEAEGVPLAGTYHGPEAVMTEVLMRLATEWVDFQTAPEEFIDGGDAIVVLGRYSGTYKITGKSFQAQFAHVWRIRDEKAIRYVQYTDTALVQGALQP
jgi:ketosteroid isomerase-like protein